MQNKYCRCICHLHLKVGEIDPYHNFESNIVCDRWPRELYIIPVMILKETHNAWWSNFFSVENTCFSLECVFLHLECCQNILSQCCKKWWFFLFNFGLNCGCLRCLQSKKEKGKRMITALYDNAVCVCVAVCQTKRERKCVCTLYRVCVRERESWNFRKCNCLCAEWRRKSVCERDRE